MIPSNRRFVRYARVVLVYNVGVVLWGAYVRATGAGAGCGNHWPLCNGEVIPRSAALNTIIEFTHRVTSGIDLAMVALLLVWAFRAFPQRHPARLGAVLSAVFLVSEALIGAALVLLEHVARNASANRAWSLSTHLVNTLTLLACLTMTAWWGAGNPRSLASGKPVILTAFTLGGVMVLGITGAIAALGDTLFPARTLSEGFAQDFDRASNIFLRLRGLHPLIAVAVAAWVLWFAGSTAVRRPEVRRRARLVLGLLAAQLAAGAMNLLLMAPVAMQMVHLLLADAFWIALVLFCADMQNPRELPINRYDLAIPARPGTSNSRADVSIRHGEATGRDRHPT
ncbi:MAG TPA: COX15/CtaA family protein [Verrucomicrobiae bacterium]|nr:COX15/CtaA family protein [Verrucomicrobiae bacterium]